uniref:Uncharacterized protein n=1 Tax=Oryza rufipogon TaxID=4529 RepID=A0A0E0PWD8_ORYRU
MKCFHKNRCEPLHVKKPSTLRTRETTGRQPPHTTSRDFAIRPSVLVACNASILGERRRMPAGFILAWLTRPDYTRGACVRGHPAACSGGLTNRLASVAAEWD